MRFTLIDRILELKPGEEIRAIKSLSLSEDYLADHFPLFPVLPGARWISIAMVSAPHPGWFLSAALAKALAL